MVTSWRKNLLIKCICAINVDEAQQKSSLLKNMTLIYNRRCIHRVRRRLMVIVAVFQMGSVRFNCFYEIKNNCASKMELAGGHILKIY